MKTTRLPMLCAAVVALNLAGCATTPDSGDADAKMVRIGFTGGANWQMAEQKLERCDKTLGTINIVEDANQPWLYQFSHEYHMPSTLPLLRRIIQQSNCFVIIERGQEFHNMQAGRALMNQGQLRKTSYLGQGQGQMAATDYTATSSIIFSARSIGAVGAFVDGMLGPVRSLIGASARTSLASTMLLLTDNRSGLQLVAAEGSARNSNANGLTGVSVGAGGLGNGYGNTPQGKLLAASFMDSYNQLVKAARNYKAQSIEGGLGYGFAGILKSN